MRSSRPLKLHHSPFRRKTSFLELMIDHEKSKDPLMDTNLVRAYVHTRTRGTVINGINSVSTGSR